MLVKYYNNINLEYSKRNRYRTIPYLEFNSEIQHSVLLGDGATTSITTDSKNICNYVSIDSTRWFVTSYKYSNSSIVTLYLQRDVIGENGISDCFGKIERGYTNSILKNRKELGLNQILKNRKKLLPDTFNYGNYSVNTHNNELWGIMYFVKPTGLDPTTGKPFPDEVNINIPEFAPNYVNYPLIDNGKEFITQSSSNIYQRFTLKVNALVNDYLITYGFDITINYNYINGWTRNIDIVNLGVDFESSNFNSLVAYVNATKDYSNNAVPTYLTCYQVAEIVADKIALQNITDEKAGIDFPNFPNITPEVNNYNGVTVKDGVDFYSYTSISTESKIYGRVSIDDFVNFVKTLNSTRYNIDILNVGKIEMVLNMGFEKNFDIAQSSDFNAEIKKYSRTKLDSSSSGNIVIDTTQQLVDEPYSILVFPLFDVNISGLSSYNIKRQTAFMVFNTVIQYLSGENAYIIDAQIYPYCPILTGVASELNGYPFFKISSNSFTRNCAVQLLPNSDIKKEYISRKYSIISPEQTGKLDLNFYDYITEVIDLNGINQALMNVVIKTALKPFSIISSAVITPSLNSLKGITYQSDLRGSQPTSNGFECSLSSNAFQTYKRQNSNYQQIFALQKDELNLQHDTERVNEVTSAVVNSLTAGVVGAIGGASIGGKIGAGIGAGVSVAATGVASGVQYAQNEKLREFESNLQQQMFDYNIGTIKAVPNSINRISAFNEIILSDFWYVIETYECSEYEKELVNIFIKAYGYGIGVFSYINNFHKNGWFLRSTLVTSIFTPLLHNLASNDLKGGIYYYE